MKKPSEFELIETYFAPLAGEGSFGLRDDAAQIIPTPGHSFVITQDAIAVDIHFFADDAPHLIAKKALRVNLSDLAAKGAAPKSFSLALGMGNSCNEDWIKAFASGLVEDCKQYDIALSGGDTFKTGGGTIISITAIGEVPEGQYVSRMNAKAGDAVFVTGTIGDGALGLLARQDKLSSKSLTDRYLLPQPRTEFASVIREYASASMDISDGLIGDLEKLCKASNVSAEVNVQNVPLSEAAQAVIQDESDYLKTALTGGDDYEILLCTPRDKVDAFIKACITFDFPVTQIGEIKTGEGVKVFDNSGKAIEFEKTSYEHSGE